MYKICSKCRKYKALWAFGRRKGREFGLGSWCKVCIAEATHNRYIKNIERHKEIRLLNREKHIEYAKNHYRENKERYYSQYKHWSKKHPEAIKIHRKRWKRKNKHISAEDSARRRAVKRNQTPQNVNKNEIKFIYNLRDIMCKSLGVDYHVDHIFPLIDGGFHHQDNLQILSAKDNLKKSDKINSKYRGVTINDINLCMEIIHNI